MTLGIERALRAAYGARLKQVVAVDGGAGGDTSVPGTTKAAVDSLLQLLRPAVTNYGGSVEVESVEQGVCTIAYDGPDPIWNGLRSAVRDKFTDLKEVKRV
jgi:NFU1 iron-sulfur cluster scaffold homolog, mitochondrial